MKELVADIDALITTSGDALDDWTEANLGQITLRRRYRNERDAANARAEALEARLAEVEKALEEVDRIYAVAMCSHNAAKNTYGYRVRVLKADSKEAAIGTAIRLAGEAEPDLELSQPAALHISSAALARGGKADG